MTTTKRKNQSITTGEGTFKWPHLTLPDTKFNSEGEYSVKVVLASEEAERVVATIDAAAEQAMKDMKAELEQKASEEKGERKAKLMEQIKKLKPAPLPYKAVYNEDGDLTGEYEFVFKMKAFRPDHKNGTKVAQRPRLFDAAGKEMQPKNLQIWSGTTGCVAGSIIPYYTAIVGAGVSLRLSAVQIINLVNSSGGGAQSFGFGAKAGGYVADEDEGTGEEAVSFERSEEEEEEF